MFVSRAISNPVLMDRSVDEYVLDVNVGRLRDVTDENCGLLLEFAKAIQNSELAQRLVEFRPDCDGLTEANVVARLLDGAGRFGEIEFAALHFCEVKNIARLPTEILERVLDNEQLTIESEDWLLAFVVEQMGGSQSLLRHVQCSYLSADAIKVYAEQIDLESVNRLIFQSVFGRLVGESCMRAMTMRGTRSEVSRGGLAPQGIRVDRSGCG
jgi:hypothetical protein